MRTEQKGNLGTIITNKNFGLELTGNTVWFKSEFGFRERVGN